VYLAACLLRTCNKLINKIAMQKQIFIYFTLLIAFIANPGFAQTQASDDTIVLRDITWDNSSPAGMKELTITSGGSLLQGFIYKADGGQKHPTLLLLHGYPGNEKNLDLAQVVRAHGWNVIYFDYRGSWGSQGQFSFKNCVEDVVNVVGFCKKYQDSLQIDTSEMVLFGHSMGGWICLKALQQLPGIKKGFVLSTWNIYRNFKDVRNTEQLIKTAKSDGEYFVLNTSLKDLFDPVIRNPAYFNLANDAGVLADKQIIMLDEHSLNQDIADALKHSNKAYFDYEVWQTDHPFTNKRVALIKKVLAFLDK
jgi:pimeloyl-ACP methyl ester carboxylesterase